MSSANKFVDDVSRVFAGAIGVAQGAKDEAENALKSWVAKLIDSKNYVSREEFEAVEAMAQKAREEVNILKAELEMMKGQSKPMTTKRATASTTKARKEKP